MRLLWYSNAPWAPTGYGNQTRQICEHLPALGHSLAVMSNYGMQGGKIEMNGIRVYPNGRDRHGNDIIQAYADDCGADAIVTLYDAWPLNFATQPGHKTPWIAWAPVDHEQTPPPVVKSLKAAAGVVAMSRHGQWALREAGFDAAYIPHGVNTAVFAPPEGEEGQRKARAFIGLPQDRFLFGMVAANQYTPSRKCIPQVLAAFAELKKVHPEAALYLHMVDDDSKEGVHVLQIMTTLGLALNDDVFIADQMQYHLGYSAKSLVELYRAMDVLVNPSLGEGFGIPIVEAMACGTPVIATRGTSMVELAATSGWLVDGDPWWSGQGTWQTLPRVGKITGAMVAAISEQEHRPENWQARKTQARLHSLCYDFKLVTAPAWDQYLRAFAERGQA